MANEQVVLEFVGDMKGLQNVVDGLKAIGQISEEQYAAFNKANATAAQNMAKFDTVVTKTEKDTKAAAKSVGDLNTAFKGVNQTIAVSTLDDFLKALAVTLPKISAEAQVFTEKSQSMKSRLRELKEELSQLESQGKDNSAQFQKIAIEAAKLEDQIGDTNTRIRRMASDTRAFDLAVEGIRGVSAAYAVAQGTQALFGEENENLQKALLKVQAATAILTGVQELANIATAKGGIASAAYGVALQAVEFIQKKVGVSATVAWGAVTGGITIALGALVYLADQFGMFAGDVERFRASMTDQLFGKLGDNIKYAGQQAQWTSDRFQRSIEMATAAGAKQSEILKLQIESNQAQLEVYQNLVDKNNLTVAKVNANLQTAFEIRQNLANLSKEEADKQKAIADGYEQEALAIGNVINQLKNLTNQSGVLAAQLQQQIVKEVEEANRKRREGYEKDLQAKLDNIEKKIKAEEDFYARVLKIVADGEKKIKEETDKRMKEGILSPEDRKQAQDDVHYTLLQMSLSGKQRLEAFADDAGKFAKNYGQAIIQIAQTISDTIFQIQAEARQFDLDEQLAHLEEKYQMEMEYIERTKDMALSNKYLTEYQRRNIERHFDDEREAAEKRKRNEEKKLKTEAFEADKRAKLASAAINTALAVINAFATAPWPVSIVMAAVAAATGAAQIAIIASQKTPKFAKGTEQAPPGFKWVGEEGPELIHDKGGYAIMSNPDSMKLMAKYKIPALPDNSSVTMPVINESLIQQQYKLNHTGIDYAKMAQAIGEEFRSSPQTHLSFDKNGMSVHFVERGRKVTNLNTIYKG